MIVGHKKHPDLTKLHEIGKAIERKERFLPSVRVDSAAWQAWRAWYRERDHNTDWTDKLPPESEMTVVSEYPPAEIDAMHARWVKSKGQTLELVD